MITAAEPSQPTAPLALLTALGLNDRMKRLVGGYVLATASVEIARRLHRQARARFAYTIAVPSGDEVYDALHDRILALIPKPRQRSILLRAARTYGVSFIASDTAAVPAPQIAAFYDSTREQTIDLDGHRIRVTLEKEDQQYSIMRDDFPRRDRIVFTAMGPAAREAVVSFVADAAASLAKPEQPRFYLATPWGDWNRRDDLEPRPLSSVVLRAGQKERLLEDLEAFLGQQADYTRLGIPYHRGYLLHGPAGTGKTSLAKAIATHLGLSVYYIPLSDMNKDARLLQLVSQVQPGSLLLLEDIDVLQSAHDRDQNDGSEGVSLSGLLNALDGIATPSGLVTVLTTNRPDVLDDALVRPGRVDLVEEVGYLDQEQFVRLVQALLGFHLGGPLPDLGSRQVAPAAVAEVLKRELGDREAQMAALHEAFG